MELWVLGPVALGVVAGLVIRWWAALVPVACGLLAWIAFPDSDDVSDSALGLALGLLVAGGVLVGLLLRLARRRD